MSQHAFFQHTEIPNAKVRQVKDIDPSGWNTYIELRIDGAIVNIHLRTPEAAERLGRQILNDALKIQEERPRQPATESRANPVPESLA